MNERKAVGSGEHGDVPDIPMQTFRIDPSTPVVSLGFRLVSDSANQAIRGGCWYYHEEVYALALNDEYENESCEAILGFRLVFSKEEG